MQGASLVPSACDCPGTTLMESLPGSGICSGSLLPKPRSKSKLRASAALPASPDASSITSFLKHLPSFGNTEPLSTPLPLCPLHRSLLCLEHPLPGPSARPASLRPPGPAQTPPVYSELSPTLRGLLRPPLTHIVPMHTRAQTTPPPPRGLRAL